MAAYDPFREMERFANTLLDPGRRGPQQMPMDLFRAGDHYILSADLPGIDPGSVDVDVDGQLLTIRAERTLATDEQAQWITRERSASYHNGVLSVTIPISEKAKPRKIEITTQNTPQQIESSAT